MRARVVEGEQARTESAATGCVVLVVEHEDDAGLGRLHQHLLHGRPGIEVETVRPYRGEALPQHLTRRYGGLLVLGGAMAAWDDAVAPWLPGTRLLLRQAVERGVPALGICLGAQLLAAANGGRVQRGAAGFEIGVHPVRVLPEAQDDALLGRVVAQCGTSYPATQWHTDAITALPPGAVHLACGERYPHQAFRLGEAAWGVQYHPEVTLADFEGWVGTGTADLASAGLAPSTTLAEVRAADGELEVLAAAHARAFADVVLSCLGAAPGAGTDRT